MFIVADLVSLSKVQICLQGNMRPDQIFLKAHTYIITEQEPLGPGLLTSASRILAHEEMMYWPMTLEISSKDISIFSTL